MVILLQYNLLVHVYKVKAETMEEEDRLYGIRYLTWLWRGSRSNASNNMNVIIDNHRTRNIGPTS